MSSPYSQYPNEPIAIIGTGCRLPGGADSSSKLWELLRNPRDVSCNIGGAGRFNLDRFYHPEGGHNGTTHTQRGYLLRENPRHFDAKFFSIPPGEAEVIDPQQRMLLEVVYEALESAGLPIHSLSGSDTACYVGIMCQDFFTVQAQDLLSVPKYAVTGIAASNASSRVSYFFDWHGPSMTIDTACSSSMVCVNEAVQALRSGTSRVAVACGTNLLLAPFMYVSLSAVGMVSPTGRCHMWDERADGYARGEGVGALVLKTLHAAIEDGDDIVCIIREIGLNHDGRTKGLTMPSAEAQAALIRETYRRARLDPTSKSDRCQFFEAHGTGTPTGDPKEASALNQAFFPNHDTAEGELLVGSIKTVVGHTEGTAGIAGILKAALAVQHGVVLPNMLFNKLNPALEPFTKFLRIPTACEPWPDVPAGQPRRASINSFGFGGANAHCIIESYEPERRSIPEVNGSVISNGSVADEIQVNGFHSNGTYCNGTAHTNGSTLGDYSTDIAAINGAITDGPTAHGLETPTTNGVCTGIASTNDAITSGSTTNGIEPPTWNSTSADTATTNGTTTTVTHQPSDSDNPSAPPNPKPLIPLAFSAACLNSLISQVTQALEYLEQNPSIPLSSLAHTLSTRRSALSLRLPIYASSVPDLREKTQAKLAADDSTTTHSVAALQAPPSILGIFTGQGAQWMGMGAALFAANPLARDILDRLDAALASLPACHRPSWTLAELLSPVTSKLHHAHSMTEAAVAQPACTAVQIVLVDLLRAAGVRFAAVVGHSSGEIAAAYAAGFLSAEDAIRVAYYRGFFAKLAAGLAGEKGAMLAAGTDVEDAEELCLVDDMLGRLCVAAHNSPSSVTLSGDIDAVELARDVFEDEQKFARLLRVDTAYHSAHMRSCSGPYLKAMRDVGIRQLMPGPDRPRWFSSVYDAEMTPEGATKKGLDGRYWVDNMLRPVLFYPALKTCLSSSDITFNFALEVGPHPALQGPAKDCIQDVTQQDMAYTGTLRRGSDDAEAFADALGSLWARFGPSHVNLGGFQKKCLPDVDVRLAAALASKLPKYPWTHEKEYWAESRKSKIHSSDPGEFHDLLGLREPDGLADEVRWRHILSVNDLRWLAGHTLQRQVVFPATGYICMVGEAAMQIVQPTGLRVAWIDVLDLEIRKAIAVHQDYGTEVILCFSRVCPPLPDATTEAVTACFNIFSSPARDATQLALHCCGKVRITLVPSSLHTESGSGKFDYASIFPARRAPVPGMNNVDIDRFYQSMRDEVGLGWDGAFRGLTKIMRKGGYSTVTATNPQFSDTDTKLLFHPAMLDCALQGLNAAFAAPGDGSIWDLVAPTHIRRVTMVPELLKRHRMDEQVAIDCTATISPTDARAKISLTGDVEVYASASQDRDRSATKLIEMEGIRISPVAPPTAEHDRPFFQESIMCLDSLNAKVARGGIRFNPEEKATALDAERVAFYYLKKLYLKTTPEMLATLPRYRQCLLAEAGRVYHRVRDGEHGFAPPSWVDDTAESTAEVMSRYDPEAIDFITAKTVGENLLVPEVLSGEVNILQYMVRNDMLERWYSEGVGQRILNQIGTDLIAKLCHKYPRMNMLEIGAGTGGSTASILSRVGENFRRYTYTDISSAFFERAAERFHAHAHKMVFKTLDITRDPSSQGFTPQSYDVVVAQNVLHATAPLKESLRHARKLLRPGGYLMLLELLRSESMRFGLVVGCLPGWWVGEDDGRKGGPLLTMDEWQSILAETGFAVDTVSEVLDQEDVWAVLSARAVDEQMVPALINPLPRTLTVPRAKNLLIVGGNNAVCGSVSLRKQVASVVSPYFERVTYLEDVSTLSPDAEQDILAKKGLHVLNLCECDSNYWEDVTEPSFENLKRLFSKAASVLWLLQGCLDENPYAGATLGFLRTIRYEIPDTAVQMLDIGTSTLRDPSPSPDLVRLVSECMLRLAEASELEAAGKLNQILWSVEPELYLNESDGQLYVPRLRCADGPNLRYNAAKRPITQFVDISSESETPLDLVWDKNDSKYILLEQHEFAPATPNNLVTIRVSCSFLSSLKTPAGFFYICLGANTQTGLKTLCLSDRQSSILTVPRSWTVGLGTTSLGVEDLAFMSFVAVDLLAKRILELAATSHGSVAILDANPVAGALLYKRLTDVGKTVLLITSNQSSEGSSTVFLHPHSPQRAINTALPSDTTLFIDASITAGNPEASAKLASRIETMLPAVCDKIKLSAMMSREASTLPETAPESISTLLQSAASFATMFSQLGPMPIAGGGPLEVLPLPKLLLAPLPPKPTSLVYWQVEQELPVSVQPVFMRKDLFRPDRTYWLAGLSGTLGLSLVDFLAAHNAKHIAISSRSPSVDDSWVAWQAKKGVTVSHFAGDLTDYESVRKTYKSIRDSGMPPIGGVAVGAMVLIDSTFMEQRFEDFQAVLRPKAMGAMNLDRLFSKESADLLTGDTAEGLDWFIGFSSLMGTTGNPGQAPYGAGNCFLKAVTKRRHDRGLAGSSIDIGPLFGVGYIERALTRESQARLMQRSGTIPSSESDLHQLFAEAVVAGRPNSGVADPGLIAGLGIQKGDAAEGAFWSKSPRLSMMIRDEGSRGASGAGDAGSASVPVRKLLEEPTVKTLDDAYEVILGAIRDRLHASKFLPDQNSQHDTTPLVELGVDSLVAVNVRSWFQKELSVEVPVMKILGGASMADLVALVLDKLPQDILSRLQAPQQETQAAYIEVPVLDKAESESSVEEDVNFGQEANGYVNGGSQMNGGLGQAKSVIDVKVAELDDVVEIEGLMLDLD